MNLHEYQAKALLKGFGLLVPQGKVIRTVEEAQAAAEELGGYAWMVKAQVHAGGRGKAGGVRYVTSKEELSDVVQSLLGKRLVTYQTDEKGQPVHEILITTPCDIQQELYLSAVIDRSSRRVTFMASLEGGVDIEKVAEETPEKIITLEVDPLIGLMDFEVRELGVQLNLNAEQQKSLAKILSGLYQAFIRCDLSLVEINPLIIDKELQLICLDAKVIVDGNALYRQSEVKALRDPSQEDPRESHAHDWQLNYIALDGNIGCMVNGAGLAMGTMDLIKLHGGSPANFLDVGGGATKERVIEAFKIILSDENVKAVLINIFGGIVRCDMIAEGIIGAISEIGVKVPVIVRLEGNNADKGLEMLSQSGLNLIAVDSLTAAAQKAVDSAK